jgi:hypothetical protein
MCVTSIAGFKLRDWLVRIVAFFGSEVRSQLFELGKIQAEFVKSSRVSRFLVEGDSQDFCNKMPQFATFATVCNS